MAKPYRLLIPVGVAIALVAALQTPAAAPAAAPPPPPTERASPPVLTRHVQRFLELEQALADALHRGDRSAAGAMLTDDFESRSAASPGTPSPRDEWLAASVASMSRADVAFSEMAVHAYDNVAVVSFRMTGGPGGRAMVVDTWVLREGAWKLAVRYQGL